MKIVSIVGARPQFIKAAVLSRLFQRKRNVTEILVHTGQHFDDNMSKVFFQELDIPEPNYNLNIAQLNHGAMTGRMIEKIEQVLVQEKPDRVLIYGDTNSTLAGALAASKLHIPLAHVEAGLRSFNMQMPEEINRIVADRLSDKLFCPTDTSVGNLLAEGYDSFKDVEIIKSGDVMQDAALFYAPTAKQPVLPDDCVPLDSPFALVTLHREENTDAPHRLRNIFAALQEVSSYLPILMPLHPRTVKRLHAAGISTACISERFCCIEPVGYLEMVFLLNHCQIVITDSGGLQKEAFFYQKACVTLRDETEWTELIEQNCNILAGSDKDRIIHATAIMLQETVDFSPNLYGSGKAGNTIVSHLLNE